MPIFFNITKNKHPKIVVIGAGIAGLTAAYLLQKEGKEVEVYEARSRVGGRVLTASVGGHVAELGAQNINDGGNAIHIRRLIGEMGLDFSEGSANLSHSYFNGEKLINVDPLLRQMRFNPIVLKNRLQELISKARTLKEILDGILGENPILHKVMAVRLAAYEGASIENLSPLYSETLYHMLLGGICSVHQGNGDLVNFMTIKGGNGLFPEKIAENLHGRVHLNQPLAHVAKELDGTFTLLFQDGGKVKADIVILAIPCSVYNSIVFEKNVLSPERLQAIQNVRYGKNAKILVPFATPPLSRRGLINDGSVSFFDDARAILTLYCTGEASRFSDQTIRNAYARARPMLELGYGGACPSFISPIYAHDRAFASYQAPVGFSWPNDPYARGSYSYISSGQEAVLTAMSEEYGEKCKTLFAPIDQKLYFAGEHASILMDVPGTMEAACESGERTARMILNTLK